MMPGKRNTKYNEAILKVFESNRNSCKLNSVFYKEEDEGPLTYMHVGKCVNASLSRENLHFFYKGSCR